MKKHSVWLLIASITITSIFYFTTIRPGHNWGGDFSLYIHHAKNIVEGTPYQETGYVYNENYPSLSPRYYPPIFPLLLAPIYAHSGLDLAPMKVEIIFTFILFLIAYGLSFRDHTSYLYRSIAILLIGFNPIFWDFKENILSDFPFLFFTYLALFAIQYAYYSHKNGKNTIPYAILIGFLIYLSYGTRTAGGVLIPALIFYDYVCTKRINIFPVAVVLSFGMFALIQAVVISGSSGYEDQILFSPMIFLTNLTMNFYNVFNFLPNFGTHGLSLIPTATLLILILSSIAFSYIKRVRHDITIYEVFTPIYFLLIVLWNATNQGTRFLLPIYPILIIYLLVFIEEISQKAKTLSRRKWAGAVPTAMVVLIFFSSYLGYYRSANFGEIPDGIQTPHATEFFTYIREETPQNAVFAFYKPRVLSLYTERSASACKEWQQSAELEACFKKIGVEYVATRLDDRQLLDYIYHNPDKFDLVFINSRFSLYRYRSSAL